MCAVRADKALVFVGNLTSPDHFHELLLDGDFLIVGARYLSFSFDLISSRPATVTLLAHTTISLHQELKMWFRQQVFASA